MNNLFYLVRRNCKVYFKDKGMFFVSMITPAILLVLYVTFLAKVFKDSMVSAFPEGFVVSEKLINATVGGELVSSLFSVICVTVAFCTNLIMVKDKAEGIRQDFTVAPIKKSTLAISYFVGSYISTLIVCLVTYCIALIYLAIVGWVLNFGDVMAILGNIFILSFFGTSLASIVNMFLKTNGQASAVGTIVSSGYGFVCGAYMPLSNFGSGLRNVLGFLPGTYGTSLMRNACLAGAYREMSKEGFPPEVVEGIKDSIDCNIYFFNNSVPIWAMWLIMVCSIVVLLGLYVVFSRIKKFN